MKKMKWTWLEPELEYYLFVKKHCKVAALVNECVTNSFNKKVTCMGT